MPVNNLIITNAGAAALVNAAANGTNSVTIASCGLSTAHNIYTAASNALIGQFKTINNISGGAIDPATIHLAFADQSNDAYDLRAIALYLTDGTLFAIYSQANPIITKVAGVDGILSVNIKLLNNNSSQILFGNTNIFNPPSTENSIGVIEIATQTETNAGTDDLRAITPKKLTAFWNSKSAWTINNDGAGSGLDADLLDGQHGAYYLDLANATNTLPSARLSGTYNISISGNAASADNATNATNANKLGNILAANYWHSANDGAGSGLDADLLDGQHGAYFLDLANATNTLPSARLSGTYNISISGNAASSDNATNATNANKLGNILAANYWHSANDGAGSGLDADLLDGYQSTSFFKTDTGAFDFRTLITNGYLRFNQGTSTNSGYIEFFNKNSVRSGYIGYSDSTTIFLAAESGYAFNFTGAPPMVSGNVIWNAGNDGAGSGLDADLLDGLHASAFIKNWAINEDIRVYLRVLSNQATNLAFADGLFIGYGNTNSGRTRIYGEGSTAAHIYPDINANLIKSDGSIYCHSGNDGAGSGFDADLLDGQHGAYYWSDGRASKSLATNGYRILPDSTIEQWGEATLTGDINQVVSFPIAFPNACLQAVGCQGGDFAVNTDAGAGVQSFTNSTITLRNGSWMTTKIRYFAKGY